MEAIEISSGNAKTTISQPNANDRYFWSNQSTQSNNKNDMFYENKISHSVDLMGNSIDKSTQRKRA